METNVLFFLLFVEFLHTLHVKWVEQYGRIYRTWRGSSAIVAISSPQHIEVYKLSFLFNSFLKFLPYQILVITYYLYVFLSKISAYLRAKKILTKAIIMPPLNLGSVMDCYYHQVISKHNNAIFSYLYYIYFSHQWTPVNLPVL